MASPSRMLTRSRSKTNLMGDEEKVVQEVETQQNQKKDDAAMDGRKPKRAREEEEELAAPGTQVVDRAPKRRKMGEGEGMDKGEEKVDEPKTTQNPKKNDEEEDGQVNIATEKNAEKGPKGSPVKRGTRGRPALPRLPCPIAGCRLEGTQNTVLSHLTNVHGFAKEECASLLELHVCSLCRQPVSADQDFHACSASSRDATPRDLLHAARTVTIDPSAIEAATADLAWETVFEHKPVPKTLKINKHLKSAVALVFKKLVDQLVDESGIVRRGVLVALLSLPKLLFFFDGVSKTPTRVAFALAAIISNNTSRLQNLFASFPSRSPPPQSQVDQQIRAIEKLIEAGELQRAYRKLMSGAGPARFDFETTKKLAAKLLPFLPEQDDDSLEEPCEQALEAYMERVDKLTVGQLTDCVYSMARLSSAGATAYSREFFALILREQAGGKLLDMLRVLMTRELPAGCWSFLQAGNLFFFPKPNRLDAFRPVAPQNALTKVIEKLLYPTDKEISAAISNKQLALAVKAGPEKMVKIVQAALQANPEAVAVALDLTNAYNKTLRRAVYARLKAIGLQYLQPWMWRVYSGTCKVSTTLEDGKVVYLDMVTGLHQGCVLSTLYFCIAHDIALSLVGEGDDVAVAIADDAVIVGTPSPSMQRMLDQYVDTIEETGNQVSTAKTQVYVPPGRSMSGYDLRVKGEVVEQTNGVVIAGVPFGSPEFIDNYLDEKMSGIRCKAGALDSLSLGHQRLLVKYCLQNQLVYLMRSLPPDKIERQALEMDLIVADRVAKMAGQGGFDPQEMTAKLQSGELVDEGEVADLQILLQVPFASCGLNLQSSSMNRHAAYVASWAATLDGMENMAPSAQRVLQAAVQEDGEIKASIDDALHTLTEVASHFNSAVSKMLTIDNLTALNVESNGKVQKVLSTLQKKMADETFLNELSEEEKAHFLSAQGNASYFFGLPPCEQGLRMTDEQEMYVLAKLLHMPTNLADGINIQCSRFDEDSNDADHHLEVCRATQFAYTRHQKVMGTLKELLNKAGVTYDAKEPRDEDNFGPDLRVWVPEHGKVLADFSYKWVESADVVKKACKEVGAAAEKVAKEKENKYKKQAEDEGAKLWALVVESGGKMGKNLLKLVAAVGNHVSATHDEDDLFPKSWLLPTFKCYMRARLLVAVLKYSAEGALRARDLHLRMDADDGRSD